MSHEKGISTTRHTVASQAAGALSTVAFFPFDTVRMRFMSQDGTKERMLNGQVRYSSTLSSARCIIRDEGVTALFRSVHVALIGVALSWGIYMYLYRTWENLLLRYNGVDKFYQTAIASVVASSMSSLIATPIWLVKTRMQLEEIKIGATGNYRSFFGGMRHAVRTDGVRSLWRGFAAQLLLGVPHAFTFPIYDFLKKWRREATKKKHLSMPEICCCSVASKTIVTVVAHPLMVLKTRLMDHRSRVGDVTYNNLLQSALVTAKREGVRGVYRGLAPSLMQVVPRSVLQFVLYELFLQYP